MKVLHLSTHDILGGAARAAFRLHQGLLAAGADSAMLVNWKSSTLDSVHQATRPPSDESFWTDLLQDHYIDANRASISNTYFSLGWPGLDLSGHPLVQEADLLHLHWISLYQSPATLARLVALGKPIVWSLHDQRALTGGCHYSAGCAKYETGCVTCPQLSTDPSHLPGANLAEQARLAASGAITVLGPSRWMADIARRSATFCRSEIEVIPNGIDPDAFRPQPRYEARLALGLPTDGVQLLFGAESCAEGRKGFSELVAALELCVADSGFRQLVQSGKLALLAFGRPDDSVRRLPVPLKAFGRVDSDSTLSAIYSAANLFLLPSLEDNLPNTLLESLSCGTPVAAFRTGGVPEVVVEGVTGFLAPTGNIRELSRLILAAAANPAALDAMRGPCRRHVEDHFTLHAQAAQCLRLYERLLQPGTAISGARVSDQAGVPVGFAFEQAFARSLRGLLSTEPSLLDVLPTCSQNAVETRFRRSRLVRRLKKELKAGAAGRLTFPELVLRLNTGVATLQAPLTSRSDRRKVYWLTIADRLLTRGRAWIGSHPQIVKREAGT